MEVHPAALAERMRHVFQPDGIRTEDQGRTQQDGAYPGGEELALRLNIGHEHMNKIERGKRGCSIDILLELSEVFGVSTDYLLTGKRAGDESIRDSVENVMDELSSLLARIDGRLA